jgi:hypothetical protein
MKSSGEVFIIDVKINIVEEFCRRLNLYKLRADVMIEKIDGSVIIGVNQKPENCFCDPRHPKMGWRKYSFNENEVYKRIDGSTFDLFQKLRVQYCIPETGIELIYDKTYILEAGFERLNGVNFKKGCYVGQEVTARMKHKTELNKGLVRIHFSGKVEKIGEEIISNGKTVGNIYSLFGNEAIAFIKFKGLGNDLKSENSIIRII